MLAGSEGLHASGGRGDVRRRAQRGARRGHRRVRQQEGHGEGARHARRLRVQRQEHHPRQGKGLEVQITEERINPSV